ncbi:unnamed protein product [Arctia plantaginis]|uniref:Uncharacterized protein n=1 Tax=Arctia plantaginis TaxID=874455 RepID=A0A8S1BFM3_ARCPL|nr:unnamed protein product [Arctia plantaginis]
MSIITRKGPIVDPGLCRCCGAIKKCRIMTVEYDYLETKEVYSEIFVDTFGLVLSHLDGEETERLICATCVVRLRDARAFRLQVLQCEERLLSAALHIHEDDTNTLKAEAVVKVEVEDPPPQQESENEVLDTQLEDSAMDDGGIDDYPDLLDEDVQIIKKEAKSKLKKSPKQKKSLIKKTVGRKSTVAHDGVAKKEVLKRRINQRSENSESQDHYQYIKKPNVETEYKSCANTITIVENSFVCPFYTSYSNYYCIYCKEIFTDPNQLREHTSTHDPTTFKDNIAERKLLLVDIVRIDCRLCLTKIDDIDLLKSHLTNCHDKKFYQTSMDFLKFRLTINNLTCTECGSTFSFFHALKKHMAEHFGPCICDKCGAHYFEERMLILHQKSHQKIEVSFSCKDCGKTFKSKHSRNLHETKMHKKEPAYPCYKCDEVLFSYSLRYRHMIDVHGDKRMFPCEHCDRAYDSRKSLREHNRRYHLKILKHQCDLCDKRFYLPSRLKEHMATHTGERNFRCEYCGKSYPRLRGLKVHMQSHNNEKKYSCVMCNASFTQNVNLKSHMKRQHQSLDIEGAYAE